MYFWLDLIGLLSLNHVTLNGAVPTTLQANAAVEPLTTSTDISSSANKGGSEISKKIKLEQPLICISYVI